MQQGCGEAVAKQQRELAGSEDWEIRDVWRGESWGVRPYRVSKGNGDAGDGGSGDSCVRGDRGEDSAWEGDEGAGAIH